MEENTKNLSKEAEKLFNQDKFKDVITLLPDKVLETHKDAELYAWRARANHRLDSEVAVTMLFAGKAIEADPNYFMGYFARACAWDVKKENDNAIADYTKAIEINPNFADAYYNRGLAWLSKNENKKTITEKEKAIADFDKAIANYNKAIEINQNDAELYVCRGNAWYYLEDYPETIKDYTKAIELKNGFANAYYNRGLVWFAKKKYDKAIADYTKGINLKPEYKDAYLIARGNAWKKQEKYDKAIADYNEAIKIKPDFENTYYIRGLAKKEKYIDPEGNKQYIDIEGSKQDFEKYLELANDENEIWNKYAKYYIKELDVMIKDTKLMSIRQLVDNIKDKLKIEEKYITHYTSLSVLKSLIFDDSKFRISEGNFMNDPSEGKELYKFLYDNRFTSSRNGSSTKTFSPKPFIGSFVPKNKNNVLNLWRFYGKEKGVEAKGCSITLGKHKFIDNIKSSLSNEKNKDARLDDESDIKFYRVVYVVHDGDTNFYIPNLHSKESEIKDLMDELKNEVKPYNGNNRPYLEKYLNSIAFLFKSDAYKYEHEVRLVVEGSEFKKKYNMDVSSPRVYIELVSIKDIIESPVIFGPKVDNEIEWKAAFYYSYEKKKAPKIKKSHLPYK